MSIIGSLTQYATTNPMQRSRVEALDFKQSREASLAKPEKAQEANAAPKGLKSDQADSNQQAYDEAFARMVVSLYSTADDSQQMSDNTLGDSSAKKPAADSALAQFMAYMEMTPAEKMRDKILKEVGMTEEELEALPPEQRAAAEREIAEKMQTLQELQAARDREGTLNEQA